MQNPPDVRLADNGLAAEHLPSCAICHFPLSTIPMHGLSVPYCHQCQVMWLSADEFAALTLSSVHSGHVADRYAEHACCDCRSPMEIRQSADDPMVQYEFCGNCNKVLLSIRSYKALNRHIQNSVARPKAKDHREQKPVLNDVVYPERRTLFRFTSWPAYLLQVVTGLPLPWRWPTRIPFGFLSLMAFCTLVYFSTRADVEAILMHAFVPGEFFSGDKLITIFTGLFVHVDLIHFLSNLYFFVVLLFLEERIAWYWILLLYLSFGAASFLAHGALTPYPWIPTVGASGALSGFLGLALILKPTFRVYQAVFVFQFRFLLCIYVGLWLFAQVQLIDRIDHNIAVWAHLGGFGAGVLVGLLMRTLRKHRKAEA